MVNEESRTLEELCTSTPEGHQLYFKDHNVPYCGIRPTSPNVECKYRAKIPTISGIYVCQEPYANLMAESIYNETGKSNIEGDKET